MKCKDCNRDIDPLEVFPGNRCLACHKKIVDNQALNDSKEVLDGFFKSINL